MIKAGGARTDAYDINLLKEQLKQSGYEFFYFPETESTMKFIEEQALKGKKSPVAALTDHQTEGEGREGRTWLDIPGRSLMFSVLFQIPQSSIASFADLIALSICRTLKEKTGLQVKIKYPNDVVIDDKKLGGILVKNIYDDNLKYQGTNAGIGINVHYTYDELGKFHSDYPATSLDICSSGMRSLHSSYLLSRDDKASSEININDNLIKRQDLLIDIAQALRFLSTEVGVLGVNPSVWEAFNKKWKEASSMYNRQIEILKDDTIADSGRVINTEIGRGVELETKTGRKWFSLFETDMKARIVRN